MDEPIRIDLDPESHRRARRRAAESGLTLSDYIVGLVRADLEAWTPAGEAPAVVPIEPDDATEDTTEEAGEQREEAVTPPDRPAPNIGAAVAARMNKPSEADG